MDDDSEGGDCDEVIYSDGSSGRIIA